jgi:hypothetical protein
MSPTRRNETDEIGRLPLRVSQCGQADVVNARERPLLLGGGKSREGDRQKLRRDTPPTSPLPRREANSVKAGMAGPREQALRARS